MGGSRSSSKPKSSKRKSSKVSSQAWRKKRSRRTKSRKLRRQDVSSSYSNDDSRSSVSISSSSSEEYSRARSRTRSEIKGSRKRTRGSSSSRGSSEASRHVKKRKGSKRSAKSDTRKKSQKKKRRREPSVSSISSDSQSCSTCRGGSSSSGKSEFERPRGRSREKGKVKRDSGKVKSGTKSNKTRSWSCSSCSMYSGDGSKDIVPVQNNLGRLRSVIIVAKSAEDEEKEWEKDGHKEEIVYDHDDYPSCRSNDSNDGGSKRESYVDLETRVENGKGEEALISDIGHTKLTKSGGEGGAQDCQSNSRSDEAGANNPDKENMRKAFASLSSSKGDDLESILRLKAMENLRKYRGGIQMNAKPPADERNKSDSEMKVLSTAKAEFVQNRSPNEDGSRVVGATRVLDQNPRSTMGRNSSHPAINSGKVQEGKGSMTESGSARRSFVCPPNQVAISGNSKTEDLPPAGAVTSKSELGKSALRQGPSGTILEQTNKANTLLTKSDVNKRSAETSKSVGQTSNNSGVGVNNVHESSTSEPPSSLKPTLEEPNSKEQQGEGKEGSQFKEKTMSVMRGGEMVQVSYKVYIPKKAPALARRQLQR